MTTHSKAAPDLWIRLHELGIDPGRLPLSLYKSLICGDLMLIVSDTLRTFAFVPATKRPLLKLFLHTV